jgi:uncharacterized RDD family membrane protein YckC
LISVNYPPLLKLTSECPARAGHADLKKVRRELGALSTLVSQPNHTPAWKQEVNRRLAEHNSRKGLSIVAPEASSTPAQGTTTRAAQAARVAARYAKVPSYSELQAAEARTAVRAAEIATEVALDAQAAASAKLASLEAACDIAKQEVELPRLVKPEPAVAPAPTPIPTQLCPVVAPAPLETSSVEVEPLETRMEIAEVVPAVADPVVAEPLVSARQEREQSPSERDHNRFEMDDFEIPVEDWWKPAPHGLDPFAEEIQHVEPDQPIHANLIQFPRELVAARKARPGTAEQSSVALAEPVAQLSIFEVDPVHSIPAGAVTAHPSPFEWSGIRLDEESLEELLPEPDPVLQAVAVELAPFSRRLLAAVVDGALIAGVFLAGAFVAASNMDELPALKILETTAAAGFVFVGLLYLALFTAVGSATPGMNYAGIALRTLDNRRPSWAQRCGRLGALLLSVLPVGLGIALAIFDDDHLSWHDRLSGTYQGRA